VRKKWKIAGEMLAASDPNQIIIGFGLGALVLAALWRLVVWVRESPVKPDPWDANVEAQLAEAPEACPHCSTPQQPNAWFCPHCGRAVGPYNNLMPFVEIFSEGEVLRNASNRHLRNRPVIMIGYLLLGLHFLPLLPIYLISFLRMCKHPADAHKPSPA
jgi:hypothetical protein